MSFVVRQLLQPMRVLMDRVQALTWLQICGVTFVVVTNWLGSAMQLVGINFWYTTFKNDPSYTMVIIPSIIWALAFFVPLVVWVAVKRPYMGFVLRRESVLTVLAIGTIDAFSGISSIYSIANTPEILQVLMNSLVPLITFGITRIALKDKVRPMTPLAATSFVLVLAAVLVSAIPNLTTTAKQKGLSGVGWIFIYLIGAITLCTYGVLQGKYQLRHTHREGQLQDNRFVGDKVTVKLVMLSGDTMWQVFLTFALFPVDALPWFGSSPTLRDSLDNVFTSADCMATCPYSAVYGMIYIVGFMISHIMTAILNHYSPTLCAISSTVSVPLQAFLLVAIPSWNVNHTNVSVWYSVVSTVLLVVACVFYAAYEEEMRVLHDLDVSFAQLPPELESHRYVTPFTSGTDKGGEAKPLLND